MSTEPAPPRRGVWEPGDENRKNPPYTLDEVRPNYTPVRLVPAADVEIEDDPETRAPRRPARWACRVPGCQARGESRTEVGATNALLAHDCPVPAHPEGSACDASSSPSSASSPPRPPSRSPAPRTGRA